MSKPSGERKEYWTQVKQGDILIWVAVDAGIVAATQPRLIDLTGLSAEDQIQQRCIMGAVSIAQSPAIVNLGIRRRSEQGNGGMILYFDDDGGPMFNWFLTSELKAESRVLGPSKSISKWFDELADEIEVNKNKDSFFCMIKFQPWMDLILLVTKDKANGNPNVRIDREYFV